MQITVIMKLYPAAMSEPITAEKPWKHKPGKLCTKRIRFAILHELHRDRFKWTKHHSTEFSTDLQ